MALPSATECCTIPIMAGFTMGYPGRTRMGSRDSMEHFGCADKLVLICHPAGRTFGLGTTPEPGGTSRPVWRLSQVIHSASIVRPGSGNGCDVCQRNPEALRLKEGNVGCRSNSLLRPALEPNCAGTVFRRCGSRHRPCSQGCLRHND